MTNIALNSSMRSNLLSLQHTAKLQSLTQNRLSTGLKVNSAIDNASAFYTASSLNNRANDLSALLDSMAMGISSLKATSEALSSATSFLEQAGAVAVQASSIPNDVFAVVSNEADFIKAVESGNKGTILIDGTINLSDNFSIELKDGQNIIGKNQNATLNFNMINKENVYGIILGNDSTISNLNINVDQNQVKGTTPLYALNKSNVSIGDININIQINGDQGLSSGAYNIKLENSQATIFGTINVNNTGAGPRIILSHNSKIDMNNAKINASLGGAHYTTGGSTTRAFEMSLGSILNINNSSINISVEDESLRASNYDAYVFVANASTININNTKINATLASSKTWANLSLFRHSNGGNININNTQTSLINNAVNGNLFSSGGVIDLAGSINVGANNIFNIQNNSDDFYLIGSGYFKPANVNIKQGAIFNLQDNATPANSGWWKTNQDTLVNANTQTFNGNPGFDDITGTAPTVEIVDITTLVNQLPPPRKTIYDSSSQQYNSILEQFDSLINDSSYKGINLLQGQSLTINFNENRTSKIDINGVDASTEALGMNDSHWQSVEEIADSVKELTFAIKQIRSFQEEFGNQYSVVQNREEFTKNLINVLTEGADKLTLADMNQESANSLALDTRQQLATNALSLASQAAQSVLKLF